MMRSGRSWSIGSLQVRTVSAGCWGWEIVDEVSYTYRYIVNENGFITRLLIVSAGRYAQDATVLSAGSA